MLWCLGAFLLNACITPFETELENQVVTLIADGELTDEKGPYNVFLTSSETFNLPPKVSGATVWITDDANQRLDLEEISEGKYQSDSNSSFIGTVGRAYILHIEVDGHSIESEPEKLVPTPPITAMRVEADEQIFISDLGNEIVTPGFQVFVDTETLGGTGTYLKWDYRGVYVVKTPAPTIPRALACFIPDEDPTENLNVFGVETNQKQPILGIPMKFFTPTVKFDTIYFFVLKQFSLNRDAFEFWNAVQLQRKSTGSIFDPVPGTIEGNMRDINDPENLVLGYFTVSSVTEEQLSITRLELEQFGLQFKVPFPECFQFSPNPINYCDSCILLDNSSYNFPEVKW